MVASACLGSTATAEEHFDEVVANALRLSINWMVPQDGAVAQADKKIVFLATTLRNGGILAVAEGVTEAAQAIDWELEILDARGQGEKIDELIGGMLASPPHGLIIGGFDAVSHADSLYRLAAAGTEIVAWHAGPEPGPVAETPVKVNVTTDPLEVAQVAAAYAISKTGGKAGAVVFTDARFGIALKKSDEMARVIKTCGGCEVLEIVDLSLDETKKLVPTTVERLMRDYGARWNVSLGINDLYFDDAALPMAFMGVEPEGQIFNISAGDGSFTAYKRIRTKEYQAATVPEPLNFQGWQLVDELNRIFAGQDISGYVAPTKLVVPENVDEEGGVNNIFDPDNGYRDTFRKAWK